MDFARLLSRAMAATRIRPAHALVRGLCVVAEYPLGRAIRNRGADYGTFGRYGLVSQRLADRPGHKYSPIDYNVPGVSHVSEAISIGDSYC